MGDVVPQNQAAMSVLTAAQAVAKKMEAKGWKAASFSEAIPSGKDKPVVSYLTVSSTAPMSHAVIFLT
jgi:Pyruvate/2-oxoacid:ferredoxin oxidoreductase gamma subunit